MSVHALRRRKMSDHSHSIARLRVADRQLDEAICLYTVVVKRWFRHGIRFAVYGGEGTPTLTFPTNGMRARSHNSFFMQR